MYEAGSMFGIRIRILNSEIYFSNKHVSTCLNRCGVGGWRRGERALCEHGEGPPDGLGREWGERRQCGHHRE